MLYARSRRFLRTMLVLIRQILCHASVQHITMGSGMLDWASDLHIFVILAAYGVLILDLNEGAIGSMRKLGVTESYKLKRQVVISASEATEMILRYELSIAQLICELS